MAEPAKGRKAYNASFLLEHHLRPLSVNPGSPNLYPYKSPNSPLRTQEPSKQASMHVMSCMSLHHGQLHIGPDLAFSL